MIRVRMLENSPNHSAKSYARFAGLSEADAAIEAAIRWLDVRHAGWPLEGALDELREPNLPAARAELLRACVEKMRLEEHP